MTGRPRSGIASVINPFIPLLLLFWKRLCLILILFIFAVIALLYALVFLPTQISDQHEYEHFTTIEDHESQESLDRWSPRISPVQTDLVPMHERPTRLIQNVYQLTSMSWRGYLTLHPDGTSEYPVQSYWIYVGGTAPNLSEPLWKRVWRQASLTSMPGGSCVDPPEVCNAFNDAFQQLADDANAQAINVTSTGLRRFIDCDNSPLLCDQIQVDPVMVIRMEVPSGGCHNQIQPRFAHACNVKWSYIGLPLLQLPFERKIRLNDGRLVPAFPSAYEQLYQLMMLHEGLDAIEVLDPPYVEWSNGTEATREYLSNMKPFSWGGDAEDDDSAY